MPLLLLLLSLSALACERADEFIIAGIAEALAEPKPLNARAVDCAKGADRYAAPGVLLAIDCSKADGGVR